MKTRARARRGFTLIEMMLVIAISGVMTGLAIVSMRDVLNSKQENGAARSLAMLLKRARVTAISTHSRVQINADTTTSVINLSACKSTFGASACATGMPLTALVGATLRLNNDELHGVKLTGAPASTAPLIFDARGFPETAGTYTYTIDHPEKSGVRTVVVTTSGDISVQ